MSCIPNNGSIISSTTRTRCSPAVASKLVREESELLVVRHGSSLESDAESSELLSSKECVQFGGNSLRSNESQYMY